MKGEVCEGTITSVFLDDGSGYLKTPPIACGLLAGVLRTELICQRRHGSSDWLPPTSQAAVFTSAIP